MSKPRMKLSDLRRVLREELRLSRRTRHTVTPRYLVSALRQRGYLTEQPEDPIPLDQKELGDSLDAQVDRYLADYERNSKTESDPTDQLEWRDLVRRIILAEAPEDEEDPEAGGGGEEGGEEEMPDDDAAVAEPLPKLGLDDIDTEQFANDVARLIENYDSLLEVRRTLIRRAVNFLAKNYDEHVVKELKYALRDHHGLMMDKSKREHEAEDFMPPPAGEAGPGGAA